MKPVKLLSFSRCSLSLWILVLGLQACSQLPWQSESLYDALGQKPGIAKIVDAFLNHLADDERVGPAFADTDIERFQRRLNEQFCELSGGPCRYSGDSMREVHDGKQITELQMNALVEDLIAAMHEANVPTPAQNRLLALLAPMHDDVVGH